MSDHARSHPVDDRCEAAHAAVLRAQSASTKLATLDAMWHSAVTLVRCGVAEQHPEWSSREISLETARRMARRPRADRRD